jgi:hypothetical protein
MILLVSNCLIRDFLALTFFRARSDTSILTSFGALLLLDEKFLNWRRKRNRTESSRNSKSGEITGAVAALPSGVETKSPLIPPGWDEPGGSRTARLPSTAESWQPRKQVDDPYFTLK